MKRYWTLEKITEEANKYKTLKDFKAHGSRAYDAATKLKILTKVTKNLTRAHKKAGYWTPEKIKEEANKYKTLKEFRINAYAAYLAAIKSKILPEVIKNLPRARVPNSYWTRETIKEAIKDFTSFKQWRKEDHRSHLAATRLNLTYDQELVGHLIKIKGKPIHKWTKKLVLEDALSSNSKSQWKSRSPFAYRAARERGYLSEATEHMELLGNKFKRCIYSIEIKNQNKIYIGLTQNFKTRIKAHMKTKRFKIYKKQQLIFKKLTGYMHVEKAVILEEKIIKEKFDQGFDILNDAPAGSLGGMELIWTKEKVIESAKKYNTIKDWEKAQLGAVLASRRRGYHKEAVAHMKILKGKWKVKDDVLNDAKKYSSRSEWAKNSPGASSFAKKNNWYNEATAHMYKTKSRKWFNKEIVIKDALKYKTKSDWHKKSHGAYDAAKKNNWLEEATSHMPKRAKYFIQKKK